VPTQNIYIQQGATFERTINLTGNTGQPLNVSGMTANASLKIDEYSNTANVYLFTTLLQTGLLTLRMEKAVTVTIPPGFYEYDVLVTNGTDSYKVLEGVAEIEGTISKI
jgi:hypothetical protein